MDDLTQGLGVDDDELQRRSRILGQIGPSESAVGPSIPSTPPAQPRIPSPSANDKTPPLTLRGVSPQLQQQTSTDQAEAKRIQDTGSGISQIQHGSKDGGIGIAKPHPILGGLLRGVDVLGSAIAPGIMANIPGTELHHERLGGQARERIGSDIEEQGKQAATAHTAAETESLENPTPAVKTGEESTLHDLMTGQNGQPRVNPDTGKPYSYLEAYEVVKSAGQKPPAVGEADKPLANLAQMNQALARRFQVLHPGEQLPPEYTLPHGATNGDYARINQSLTGEEGAVGTSQTHADAQASLKESRAQRQANVETSRQDRLSHQDQERTDKLAAPTAATKSMIEAAPGVITLANRVKQLVDQQKANLGPASSRWAEFMAGKVGDPNPEFTKLRTDVGLLTTKLMRMHVGARGGEIMMGHFKDLIDTGKQSPENLQAALDEIIQYAQETQVEGQGGGQSSPVHADAGPKATHVYDPKTGTIKPVQ